MTSPRFEIISDPASHLFRLTTLASEYHDTGFHKRFSETRSRKSMRRSCDIQEINFGHVTCAGDGCHGVVT